MQTTPNEPVAGEAPANRRIVSQQILLVAAESSVARVAPLLAQELQAAVTSATDHRRCQELLQHKSYTVILVEEAIALDNETTLKNLYAMAGEAFILEVNFGISNAPRILGQLRTALKRRDRDIWNAKHTAMVSLQRELNASISGLLLKSQLALRNAGPELAPTLDLLVQLAEDLTRQLRF